MRPDSALVQASHRAPAPASRAKACISAEALSAILRPSPQLVRSSSASRLHQGPRLLRWASSQRPSAPGAQRMRSGRALQHLRPPPPRRRSSLQGPITGQS
ncbi:hypothetical protein NDU88_003811 [Pleurodeles waltl]|uniref:Uncharacterized protein n=1 Tax=Pleurodeles waltl TaxID=8319 RepID=A0AAV7TQM6_PLEWA|nr:hypothetical protein NDU88_003811 [Pleurodeles waltl]